MLGGMKKLVLVLLSAVLSDNLAAAELNLFFYGAPVQMEFESSLQQAPILEGTPGREQLESRMRLWDEGALFNFSISLKTKAQELHLDDVATARLMRACAVQLYGETLDAALFEWLILRHCGYDALLGTGGTLKVYLHYAFLTEGTQFILFMGKKYTLPQGEPDPFSGKEQVFVSMKEPAAPRSALFFNMHELPLLGKSRRLRKCTFTYAEKEYKLFVPWMDDVVDYLNDLPVIALGPLFYQTPMNLRAQQVLHDSLSTWTRGFTSKQTLDFLLAFLQQAFPYKRDKEYLRYDRHNFAEQTLAAAFADCEDKAVLFAQLVRDLLGYPALLIYNKSLEHVSVAIAWSTPTVGHTLMHEQKRYLICEPANYGYRAGESKLPADYPGDIIALQ